MPEILDEDNKVLPANLWTVDEIQNGTPATAGEDGVKGTIKYDTSYIYVCVADNTWKRVAIATW